MQVRSADTDEAETIHDLVQRAHLHCVARIGVRPRPMDADYPALVDAGQVWVAVTPSNRLD